MTFTLPSPRTPDPMDAPPLRWGMLGTGWIEADPELTHPLEDKLYVRDVVFTTVTAPSSIAPASAQS